MPQKRLSDFAMGQMIHLGGKISGRKDERGLTFFKEIAYLSPDYADIYAILLKKDKWLEMTLEKRRIDIIKTLGMVDFLRYSNELTRLSMIIGAEGERTHSASREVKPNADTIIE